MDTNYEIRKVKATKDTLVNVLAKEGEKDFLSKLHSSGKTKYRARVIAGMMEKVARFSTDWAIQAKKLKQLTSDVSVFELRADGKVIRVMTYLHDDEQRTPIYLFDFDGHQGKGGHIKKSDLARAKKLASLARGCMMGGME